MNHLDIVLYLLVEAAAIKEMFQYTTDPWKRGFMEGQLRIAEKLLHGMGHKRPIDEYITLFKAGIELNAVLEEECHPVTLTKSKEEEERIWA